MKAKNSQIENRLLALANYVLFLLVLAILSASDIASAQIPDPLPDDPGGPGSNPIPPSPAEEYSVSEAGVDMRTGQFLYSNSDLSIGNLSLTRHNGSNDWKWSKPMGQFSHNWHIYVTYKPIKTGGAQFAVVADGRGHGFTSGSNSNSFTARSLTQRASIKAIPIGSGALDRYLVYTAADGTKITFRRPRQHRDGAVVHSINGTQRKGIFASKVEEIDGTTYWLSYDEPTSSSPAYLRRVTSNRGYALIFQYVSISGFKYVSKVCAINLAFAVAPSSNICPAGEPTGEYVYGSNGRMTSFRNAAMDVHRYSSTYSKAAWINAPSPPKEYEWTETYTHPGQATPYLTNIVFRTGLYENIKSQTFADGRIYNYVWNITHHNDYTMEVAGGVMTRNDGATTTVQFQEMTRPGYQSGDAYLISSGPKRVIDALGRESTGDYCIRILVHSSTGCAIVPLRYWISPDGNRTEYERDLYGNILESRQKAKPDSTAADIVTKAVYGCNASPGCFTKPMSITDANGNTTSYTYSTETGQVLTATGPAVNGVSPQTRYTYAQRYAWIKNSSG
ncbi:hypothetical protein, partial [Parasphingorhabdus litoris]